MSKQELKKIVRFDTTLLYDPDSYDLQIIGEQDRSYGSIFNDAIPNSVLDFGGNRGYFAAYAYFRGTNNIASIEPEPSNIEIYKKNAPECAILIEGAAAKEAGEGVLYVSKGINHGTHSIKPKRGRETIPVKFYNFWDLMEQYRPEFVKIDIENSEYMLNLDEKEFPDFVKYIAIEYTIIGNVKENIRNKILSGDIDEEVKNHIFYKTYKKIKSQFPTVLKDSTLGLTKMNWDAVYCGKR